MIIQKLEDEVMVKDVRKKKITNIVESLNPFFSLSLSLDIN